MNPIDPRRSERHLLAAVHHWARTHGCTRSKYGWQNGNDATATALVTWVDGRWLGISWDAGRFGDGSACWSSGSWIRMESVVQAVDVLVALDILPAWLSSAYGLAEDRYREQVETLTEELERAQGAYRDVVAGWAERADVFTVGARVEIGGPR